MKSDNKPSAEKLFVSPEDLSKVFELAATEESTALGVFFMTLLRSKVFVPTGIRGKSEVPLVGNLDTRDVGMVTTQYEGDPCVPIFSELEFLYSWMGYEAPYRAIDFSSLLWLVPKNHCLYINSGQEIGREITAWEIEMLKEGGEEAIAEIVLCCMDECSYGVEVNSDSRLFADFKRALIPIFEVYPELIEAFIVGVKEEGAKLERPVIGLRYKEATSEQKKYIKSEIERTAAELIPAEQGVLMIVDDLESDSCSAAAFFEDAKPCYIVCK